MRLLYLTLVVVLAGGVSAAGAQTSGKDRSSGPSVNGVVKAISDSLLTIERDGIEVAFSVNSSTRVLKPGRQTGPGYYPNGARDLVGRTGLRITDVLKPGERVTVRFRQSGPALQAVEVRVVPTP